MRPLATQPGEKSGSSAIDKSVLTLPEPRRIRDKDESGLSPNKPASCAADSRRARIISANAVVSARPQRKRRIRGTALPYL
jgi:hypothetical protein